MNEWFHCNKCFVMGSAGGSFWFTSCGHILCTNCLKLGVGPTQKGPCIVCQKQGISLMEINRSMRPDILMIFRPPKDLLIEFTQKLKTSLDFQNAQRLRLIKHLQEKCGKAVKFARAAQVEVSKRAEREKILLTERNQAKVELEKSKEYIQQLEQVLTDRDQEIQRIKLSQRNSPQKNKVNLQRNTGHVASRFPSLNGNTPLQTLSFFGCATSTPNVLDGIASTPDQNAGQFENLFCTQQAREDTPLACAPTYFPNTPLLLGLTRERRKSSPIKDKFF